MILPALRDRTAILHQRIERTINLPSRLTSRESYASVICQFYGFYQPLEQAVEHFSADPATPFDLNTRLKTKLLRQDLMSLGFTSVQVDDLPVCQKLPQALNVPALLGCFYVMEGATLGGQIVLRQLQQADFWTPQTGCSFFSSYGTQTRTKWTEFCQTLTAYAEQHPQAATAIVESAAETFTQFDAWLAR